MKGSEHGPFSLKSHKAEEDPEAGWRNVVTHYSNLRLTYEKDRLPAISAVVERMQRLRQDDVYLAGMWEKTLRHDLCWSTHRGPELARRPDRPGTVMPSWSWISTSSCAVYGDSFLGVEFCHVELLLSPDAINVVYNIIGPAHIGQVSHAIIHLKARFMLVKPVSDDWFPFQTLKHPDGIWGNDRPLIQSSRSGWDFDFRTADPPINTNENLIFLLLSIENGGLYFGIVLRELANGQFERVGFVIFHKSDKNEPLEELVASLPVRQFTIV